MIRLICIYIFFFKNGFLDIYKPFMVVCYNLIWFVFNQY